MELKINTKGKDVICHYDECDHGLISSHHWFLSHGYVCRNHYNKNGVRTKLLMHREIMGITAPDIKLDHGNGIKLDNRRSNLRVATFSENNKNRSNHGEIEYKGVSAFQRKPTHTIKYTSRITVGGKTKRLGYFKSKIAAAIAYDVAAELYHGEFARYNFPQINI